MRSDYNQGASAGAFLCVLFILFVTVCGFFFAGLGAIKQVRKLKQEAISRGVAEWKINEKTGNTTFNWIVPPKTTQVEPVTET